MRLDKYLSNLGFGSRKEIAKDIKAGVIFLNGELIISPEKKINLGDKISFLDFEIEYKEKIYVILNKQKDYVSSNIDEANYKSYKKLIEDCPYSQIIEVAGRLDSDTTGLLLLISDGHLIHKIINPKNDIFKTYYVKTKEKLDEKSIMRLEKGVEIDDYYTKEAKIKIISDNEIELSISEGKFHQIKKMLNAVKNEVVELHRISIGDIKLGDLEDGKWRYLNNDEIKYIESL